MFTISANILNLCINILNKSGVICLPTDTVYGLVVSAKRPSAIDRMSEIKGRPKEKPFALFVSSIERLAVEDVVITPLAQRLAEECWPGALTLVVPAGEKCPCSQNSRVGARCPDSPFIQDLLQACGGLLVNTSLNRSGEPAACSLEGMEDLLAELNYVVDVGPLPSSPASTVVDCTGDFPKILRAGVIREERILRILGNKK